jgi:signal recognition particle GTPase
MQILLWDVLRLANCIAQPLAGKFSFRDAREMMEKMSSMPIGQFLGMIPGMQQSGDMLKGQGEREIQQRFKKTLVMIDSLTEKGAPSPFLVRFLFFFSLARNVHLIHACFFC